MPRSAPEARIRKIGQNRCLADVVPGVYATSINIHSSQLDIADVPFLQTIVISGLQPSANSVAAYGGYQKVYAGNAQVLNCAIIMKTANIPPSSYVQGVVNFIVEPVDGFQPALDIVATYTSSPLRGGNITLEVVPIAGNAIN
jgi:hypothetical protein